MNDGVVVCERDRVTQRLEETACGIDMEAALELDRRGQIAADEQLHAQIRASAPIETRVDDLHDVRMTQPREHLDLALEARQHLRRRDEMRMQHFDRDTCAALRMRRRVDIPEAPAAEPFADHPLSDSLASCEIARLRWRRRP